MLYFCCVKTIRSMVKNIAQRENIFDAIVEAGKPSRNWIHDVCPTQRVIGKAADLLRGNEDSTHIVGDRDTRSRTKTRGRGSLEKPSVVYPRGLSSGLSSSASFRKLGEQPSPLQEREVGKGGTNVPTNGIDPSLVVNAVAMAIDTRCQERTNRSKLQPRLRTTRRARIRPQSFREITANAIAAVTRRCV